MGATAATFAVGSALTLTGGGALVAHRLSASHAARPAHTVVRQRAATAQIAAPVAGVVNRSIRTRLAPTVTAGG
jgi:hypothetical protein